MNERYIKKKIMDYLKTLEDGYFFPYYPAVYGHSGVSDILGLYRGIFVAIEVKYGKNKVTKLQENFLMQVAQRGGLAIIAYSLEDVKKFFNALDNIDTNIMEHYNKIFKN